VSSAKGNTDQIGKVFVVRSHGFRECLVCRELFTRTTARAHIDVTCYPDMECCFNIGGNDENLRQQSQTDRSAGREHVQ
jgi:hypothetical protein